MIGLRPTWDLRKVEKVLGKSLHVGEHHDEELVCYRASREGDSTVLAFESSLVGGSYQLGSLLPAPLVPGNCLPSPKVTKATRLSNGLELGMTKAAVSALLGTPQKESGDEWSYHCEEVVPLSKSDRAKWEAEAKQQGKALPKNAAYCRMADVVIRFTSGRVSQVEVGEGEEPSWLPY